MVWTLVLLFLGQIAMDISSQGWSGVRPKLALGPDLLLGFFLGIIALGVFLRIPEPAERWESLGEVRWVIPLYAVSYLIRSYWRPQWVRALVPLMVVACLVSLYALFQTMTGIDLTRTYNLALKTMGSGYYRAIGFFSLPLTFAYSLGQFMMLCLALALVVKDKMGEKLGWLLVLTSFFSVLGIIGTGVRGAWVALLGSGLVLSFLLGRRLFFRTAGIGLLLLSVMLLALPTLRHRVTTIWDVKQSSNAGRIKIWRAAIEMWKDYPVLGTGLNYNVRHMAKYYEKLGIQKGKIAHAHSNYLQFLTSTGLLGLLAFLALSGYFLWLNWILWKGTEPYLWKGILLGLFSAQVFVHIGGFTECNFIDGEVQHSLTFSWAFLLAWRGIGVEKAFPSQLESQASSV